VGAKTVGPKVGLQPNFRPHRFGPGNTFARASGAAVTQRSRRARRAGGPRSRARLPRAGPRGAGYRRRRGDGRAGAGRAGGRAAGARARRAAAPGRAARRAAGAPGGRGPARRAGAGGGGRALGRAGGEGARRPGGLDPPGAPFISSAPLVLRTHLQLRSHSPRRSAYLLSVVQDTHLSKEKVKPNPTARRAPHARRRRGSHLCARGGAWPLQACPPDAPVLRHTQEWSLDSPTPSRPAATPQGGSASRHARRRPVRVVGKGAYAPRGLERPARPAEAHLLQAEFKLGRTARPAPRRPRSPPACPVRTHAP